MIAANSLEGRAKEMADRIERLEIDIEEEQARCKDLCKPMREDIKEIWAEAKGGELPEKAMRAYVKLRGQQRKTLAKLNPHEREAFDRLREALGPLGAAAADRAGFGDTTASVTLETLRARSRVRTTESMADTTALSQIATDAGLISQEATDETARIAAAVSKKYGTH